MILLLQVKSHRCRRAIFTLSFNLNTASFSPFSFFTLDSTRGFLNLLGTDDEHPYKSPFQRPLYTKRRLGDIYWPQEAGIAYFVRGSIFQALPDFSPQAVKFAFTSHPLSKNATLSD